MNLLTYRPPPPLADLVDLFWLYRRDTPTHPRERLLPMGTMELVVNLSDDRHGPVVCGAHSESFEIGTAEPATVLGVHFKPGGAFPFLNLPAGELHNAHVSLEDLWGRRAGDLQERLLEARTAADQFRVLEQALLARAFRPLVRHRAVAFALKEFERGAYAPAVADVIERTGLSHRRFIQRFADEVGLTPKLFCRVSRFQDVVRRIAGSRQIDWVQVALACGYYDQAHFIHDFRAFSGLSPTKYLEVRGDHVNHVPLAD
jgi:AraC-like DNA-binding protein